MKTGQFTIYIKFLNRDDIPYIMELGYAMPTIPRKGEILTYRKEQYLVQNVAWNFDEYNITIVVSDHVTSWGL